MAVSRRCRGNIRYFRKRSTNELLEVIESIRSDVNWRERLTSISIRQWLGGRRDPGERGSLAQIRC